MGKTLGTDSWHWATLRTDHHGLWVCLLWLYVLLVLACLNAMGVCIWILLDHYHNLHCPNSSKNSRQYKEHPCQKYKFVCLSLYYFSRFKRILSNANIKGGTGKLVFMAVRIHRNMVNVILKLTGGCRAQKCKHLLSAAFAVLINPRRLFTRHSAKSNMHRQPLSNGETKVNSGIRRH